MSAWVPVSYHPEITETYNGYGCLTVEVLLSDDRVFDAEFEFWEREYDWFVYPPATPMDGPKYGPGTRVINPANWMKVAA